MIDMQASLPSQLFTAEQVRRLDAAAIASGIAPIHLMKRAGRCAFGVLQHHWPMAEQVCVFAGTGNNGGDGFIVAALAAGRGLQAQVILLGDKNQLNGEALLAYQFAVQEGVSVCAWQDFKTDPLQGPCVLVDALLGTGLSGDVRETYVDAIRYMNFAGLPTLALDIPSGLCADSGAELGAVVMADITATFVGLKRGLFTGRGPAVCGQLYYFDLDIPVSVLESERAEVERADWHDLLGLLPEREVDAYKNHFGHVMVVGGDLGMGGAVGMASEAAARSGAGLVSVATRPEHLSAVLARHPEVMVHGVPSGQALEPLLEKPTVLAVGPGLGRSPWSEQLLQQAVKSETAMVLDADGLNILAEGRVVPEAHSDDWVLTPHPGEAARLLGLTTAEVQANRIGAVKALQEKFGGIVVLKGAGSLIVGPDTPVLLCPHGNPGMATAGMGDVLSGLIAGLIAQDVELFEAAAIAVYLHALAGDAVAEDYGQRGIMATDLLPYVRELLNAVED